MKKQSVAKGNYGLLCTYIYTPISLTFFFDKFDKFDKSVN
jgi:hypothetical protein